MSDAKWTQGPWHWSKYMGGDAQAEELKQLGGNPVRSLMNDGSTPVSAGEGDDRKQVATVTCQTPFKRGEGWQAECEERDANARLIAEAFAMEALLEPMLDILGSYVAPTTAAEKRQIDLIDRIADIKRRIESQS